MSNSIAAVTVAGPGAPFVLSQIEIDEPRDREVLVRVEAVGMCHADLAARDGEFPFPLPGVVGHEGVGVIEQVGAGVTTLRSGQRVILTFDSCGHCDLCLSARSYSCRDYVAHNFSNGARPDGSPTLQRDTEQLHGSFFGQSSFATHALANERNAVPVTTDVAPELLAPLGCGVQTGAGGVLNVLRPAVATSLAVFGAGAVGLAAVMAAALQSLGAIIVVDPQDQRLELARRLGATHTINPIRDDPPAAIADITAGGAEFALESSGNTTAFTQCLASVGPGGTVGVVGSPPFGTRAQVDVADLVNSNKHLVGIVEGASNPQLFLPQLAELVASGALPVAELVTTYPLSDIATAAEAMSTGRIVKPVLLP